MARAEISREASKSEGWLCELKLKRTQSSPRAGDKNALKQAPIVSSVWVQVSCGHLRIRVAGAAVDRIFDQLDVDKEGVIIREDLTRAVQLLTPCDLIPPASHLHYA